MNPNTTKRTDNMLTLEQQTLAEDHYRFAMSRAHKFNNSLTWKLPVDDVISAALFGLTKAAASYVPGKSKFMTYAARVIDNELCSLLRKGRWSDALFNERFDPIQLSAKVDIDTTCPEIESFIRTLPGQEQRIIELRLEGVLQKEIGEQLGLSQSYISRVLIAIGEEYLEWRDME